MNPEQLEQARWGFELDKLIEPACDKIKVDQRLDEAVGAIVRHYADGNEDDAVLVAKLEEFVEACDASPDALAARIAYQIVIAHDRMYNALEDFTRLYPDTSREFSLLFMNIVAFCVWHYSRESCQLTNVNDAIDSPLVAVREIYALNRGVAPLDSDEHVRMHNFLQTRAVF